MGNLCGKEESASTAPPGRILGSAPASSSNSRAPVIASKPKNHKKPKVTGPGRTLADSSLNRDGGGGEQSGSAPPTDARAAAAMAAEKRLNNTQKSGKLGAQLDQVKRKTQNQHIQDLAKSKGEQERLVWD